MASSNDHISMALFCDFENVALGVRDAQYDKFDIKRVLERLLLKGSIVVKKAYCDWDRYRAFKGTMHEANFELIEIPHVRQSGKNSADIRLVVDALDLCYTKSHVNTFVIISGDSDFSPLVSKLRENAKHVIGVGVKQSTSDLLIANCDEFIFYDDLVRESQRNAARRDQRENNNQPQQPRRSPEEERRRRDEMDARRTKIVELAAETYEALVTDRDEGGRIWASVLKEALKRRNPGFNESYYGFRTFGNLLEEAQSRGLLEFGRDEKSGTYVFRGSGVPTVPQAQARTDAAPAAAQHAPHAPAAATTAPTTEQRHATDTAKPPEKSESRRRGGRGGRNKPVSNPANHAPADHAPMTGTPQPAPTHEREHEPEPSWYEPVAPELMPAPALLPSAPLPLASDAVSTGTPDDAPAKPARSRRPPAAKKAAPAKASEKAPAKRAPRAPKARKDSDAAS